MIFSFAQIITEGGDTVHGKEKKEKEEINWSLFRNQLINWTPHRYWCGVFFAA